MTCIVPETREGGWYVSGHLRPNRKRIQSHAFHIASRADLIRMKEIAARERGASSDLQDLEFLRKS